jgi:hypothetical protein
MQSTWSTCTISTFSISWQLALRFGTAFAGAAALILSAATGAAATGDADGVSNLPSDFERQHLFEKWFRERVYFLTPLDT